MFIHVPPGIVFGGTCATPWKTLIFPILKTVLTLMFKKAGIFDKDSKNMGLKS